MNKTNHEKYLQCPYCTNFTGGHCVRVPRTIGKYRVKISYENILSFHCSKCGRVFKYEIIPQMYLWERMTKKVRETFNKEKGGKKTHDKKV